MFNYTESKRFRRNRRRWGNESMVSIIENALTTSNIGVLRLTDIYNFMMNQYEYFREPGSPGRTLSWKNTVRHTLSSNRKFMRIKVRGYDGTYWALSSRIVPSKSRRNKEDGMDDQNGNVQGCCDDGGSFASGGDIMMGNGIQEIRLLNDPGTDSTGSAQRIRRPQSNWNWIAIPFDREGKPVFPNIPNLPIHPADPIFHSNQQEAKSKLSDRIPICELVNENGPRRPAMFPNKPTIIQRAYHHQQQQSNFRQSAQSVLDQITTDKLLLGCLELLIKAAKTRFPEPNFTHKTTNGHRESEQRKRKLSPPTNGWGKRNRLD